MIEIPIDPLLFDFPDQFETERLIIRAPRPGDGVAGNEAIRESITELQPWMPWAQTAPIPSETEAVYRRGAAQWLTRDNLLMALIRKSDGMFVGGSGLHRINWTVPKFEIGF